MPSGREARLWRVVVELALSVEEAPVAQPGAKPRPLPPGRLERLVVEFDDAYTTYVEGMLQLPSEAQLVALQAVDGQLAAMVRAQDAELWTERALRADDRWSEAQRLARAVIRAYDWPARRLELVASGASAAVGSAGAVGTAGPGPVSDASGGDSSRRAGFPGSEA